MIQILNRNQNIKPAFTETRTETGTNISVQWMFFPLTYSAKSSLHILSIYTQIVEKNWLSMKIEN